MTLSQSRYPEVRLKSYLENALKEPLERVLNFIRPTDRPTAQLTSSLSQKEATMLSFFVTIINPP